MQEARRQAYLQVLGVPSWIPRQELSTAGRCLRPLPLMAVQGASMPVDEASAAPVTQPRAVIARVSTGPDSVRAAIQSGSAAANATNRSEDIVSEEAEGTDSPKRALPVDDKVTACRPFVVQLWLAGPCALLLEVPADGLGGRSPAARLLNDILRAAGLPQSASFVADFKWPLTSNSQFERTEMAAHQALQVFVQARLEKQTVLSIGSFGACAGLLARPSLDAVEACYGREEELGDLPPVWFAPALDQLLTSATSKSSLWRLLQRVMTRWQSR
jgi:hypothetical protein